MAWKALRTSLAAIPGLIVFLFVSGVGRGIGAEPNLALFIGSGFGFGVFFFVVKAIKG
jgi:hypothetical protein